MKKIVLLNLLLFVFLLVLSLVCFEFWLNSNNKKIAADEHSKIDITDNDNTFDYEYDARNYHFRRPSIINDNADVIILSGCSFVFGYGIPYKDTFGVILSDYTKYNVYNLAVCGGSPRELLYILKNKTMLNSILNPKPSGQVKYFIYTYIFEQNARLYYNIHRESPVFKLKNGLLVYSNQKQTNINLEIVRFFRNYISENLIPKRKTLELLTIYFKQINSEIKKKFGKDTVFILLVYDDENHYNWSELEKENIKVIKVKDIVQENIYNPEHTIWDYWHPNKKAWEAVVPALAKELDL